MPRVGGEKRHTASFLPRLLGDQRQAKACPTFEKPALEKAVRFPGSERPAGSESSQTPRTGASGAPPAAGCVRGGGLGWGPRRLPEALNPSGPARAGGGFLLKCRSENSLVAGDRVRSNTPATSNPLYRICVDFMPINKAASLSYLETAELAAASLDETGRHRTPTGGGRWGARLTPSWRHTLCLGQASGAWGWFGARGISVCTQ